MESPRTLNSGIILKTFTVTVLNGSITIKTSNEYQQYT